MATPSSGLRRSYNCSALLSRGKFLLCGTDVGDMVVYGCVRRNRVLHPGRKTLVCFLLLAEPSIDLARFTK